MAKSGMTYAALDHPYRRHVDRNTQIVSETGRPKKITNAERELGRIKREIDERREARELEAEWREVWD